MTTSTATPTPTTTMDGVKNSSASASASACSPFPTTTSRPNHQSNPSFSTSNAFYATQLLRTGAFADCTVTCRGGRSFAVHRAMLSPRCAFFRCCLDGRFNEASGSRTIAMEDDDPVAVEGLLYYLYTLEYPRGLYEGMLGARKPGQVGASGGGSDSGIEDDQDEDEGEVGDVRVYWGFDLCMFIIAEKYGVEGMRELAERALLDKAAEEAEKGKGGLVRSLCGFVGLVGDLYSTEEVAEPLKRLRMRILESMCEIITSHIRDERLSALVAQVPEFAVELVEVLGRRTEEKRRVQVEEEKKREALRVRLTHIPMNDESDCDD